MTARTTEKSRSRSQCISAPTTERFLGIAGLGGLTASVALFSSMTLRDDLHYCDTWKPGEATILMDVRTVGFVAVATRRGRPCRAPKVMGPYSPANCCKINLAICCV